LVGVGSKSDGVDVGAVGVGFVGVKSNGGDVGARDDGCVGVASDRVDVGAVCVGCVGGESHGALLAAAVGDEEAVCCRVL